MTSLVERLRTTSTKRTWDSVGRPYDYPKHLLLEAADRIEALERQIADARDANGKLHRRAQGAEGKIQRMEEAHRDACSYAFTKYINYGLYGHMLLNCNKSLFPKLVSDGRPLPDVSETIRAAALEEAAKVVENIAYDGLHGSMWEQKFRAAAAAIRALSDSTPTPLQEQNANMGKEEG